MYWIMKGELEMIISLLVVVLLWQIIGYVRDMRKESKKDD